MMEPKKISFGFIKTKKAEKPIVEEKKDFIECVEEKSIKIVGGEEVQEYVPLVIPMKPNTLITAERLNQISLKVEKDLEEPEVSVKTECPEEIIPENETLDQMAVRELLQDAQKHVKIETTELSVPIPVNPIMDGQKESTLEDYEAIPVQDFGMAMLRGMGWTPNKDQSKYKQPELRPKGLGLGADKVIAENQKKKSKEGKEEELYIVKNSYVKITTGKYSGYYGKVVSLDEDNGRVVVDITIKKETVSFSEFMLHPVTKAEFDKESKVINADKFEEYKKHENIKEKSRHKDRGGGSSSQSNQYKDYISTGEYKRKVENSNGNDRSIKERRRSTSRDERLINKKELRRSSSNSEDRYSTVKIEKDRRKYTPSPEQRTHNRKKEHRRSCSSEDSSHNRRKKERNKSSSNDIRSKHKRKDRKRYSSSNESLSSLSDSNKRSKKKSKKKYKSSDSESSVEYKSKKNGGGDVIRTVHC